MSTLDFSRVQWAPPSSVWKMPLSSPAYSVEGFFGSSAMVCTPPEDVLSPVSPEFTFVQVAPWSAERRTPPAPAAAYTVPDAPGATTMPVTKVPVGRLASLCHDSAPSVVRYSAPSSAAYMTAASAGSTARTRAPYRGSQLTVPLLTVSPCAAWTMAPRDGTHPMLLMARHNASTTLPRENHRTFLCICTASK